jgi:hypothetical protein
MFVWPTVQAFESSVNRDFLTENDINSTKKLKITVLSLIVNFKSILSYGVTSFTAQNIQLLSMQCCVNSINTIRHESYPIRAPRHSE